MATINDLQDRIAELEDINAQLQGQLNLEERVPVPPPAIHRVTVKLPPFWFEKPALWFAQAEAQFAVAGITRDDTMYNYVI